MEHEHPLSGGQTSVVVRVGDTVRRSAGHWTPLVHALLRHVRAAGFDAVPEPLGFDAQGREVLRYVEGEVGVLGGGVVLAPWFRSAQALVAVGEWLRGFHAAQGGFDPATAPLEAPPGAADPPRAWRMAAATSLPGDRVVCHHDVSPYNAVHTPSGRLVVVDFDFCAPDPPVADLAWSAWRWLPLMTDVSMVRAEYGFAPGSEERAQRLSVLADAYGLPRDGHGGLLDAVVAEQRRHAATLRALAVEDPFFAALVAGGGAASADADAAWLAASAPYLTSGACPGP